MVHVVAGAVYLSGHPQSVPHLHLTADPTARTGHPLHLHLTLLQIHHTVVPAQHTPLQRDNHKHTQTHTQTSTTDVLVKALVLLSVFCHLSLSYFYDHISFHISSVLLLRSGDAAALLDTASHDTSDTRNQFVWATEEDVKLNLDI